MKKNLINILLIIVSYGILFLLPKELGVLSYTIFGISIFLFIVGYFRLVPDLKLTDRLGYKPAYFLTVFLGLIAFTVGALFLYFDHGSGKSMIIAFLLLMEGITFLGTNGGDVINIRVERLTSRILYVFAVFLAAFAVFIIVKQKTDGVTAAFMVLIECVAAVIMGIIRRYKLEVVGMKTPIRELFQKFETLETELGYPWFGKVGRHKECILYGPNEDGFSVFGYYNRSGKFYLELADAGKKTMTIDDSNMLERYQEMFDYFVSTEKASCRSRTTATAQPEPCSTAAGDVRTASESSEAGEEDISSTLTTARFLSALVSRSEQVEANALMKSETAVRIFGKYFIKYRVNLQTFLLIFYIGESGKGIQKSGTSLRIHDFKPLFFQVGGCRMMLCTALLLFAHMDVQR